MTRLLFVCLGNICRSPTAEAVMKQIVEERGLSASIFCDSAGTSGWHEGGPADERMISHGAARGYHLTSRSRKFQAPKDFEMFDFILAMDDSNWSNLAALDPTGEFKGKLHRMTDFCSVHSSSEVPDPYYGGPEGFEHVIDLLEDACEGLLRQILSEL